MRTLIRNGTILTMEGPEPELVFGDLGLDGSRIAFIGSSPAGFSPERTIDAAGGVVMPGLVDAHTHIAMSLLRHYADDLPFWNWLFERVLPAEEKLCGRYVYDGSTLSLAEMIRGGVTCFADMYFFMDEVARATERAGLRARLSRGLAFNAPGDEAKLDESRAFHAAWNGAAGGRILVDVAPHAVYTCPPAFIERASDLASELGCMIHVHLSESRKEVADCLAAYGKSPVAHVRDLGLFRNRTYAAHCVHVDDADIATLAEGGVAVVNNPSSNLKLGNGFAPVGRMLAAGVNVALGTDGQASNNNLNMFEEMHVAALVNKGFEEDPTALSAYTTLRMATIGGARALGLDEEIGSLRVGKKADLIILDASAPHFYPRNSVTAALVYAAQGQDVRTVFCDGEPLMLDGAMTTIDEAEACAKAQESASAMTGGAGFTP